MDAKAKAQELVEKFRLHNSSTQDENYKITRNYSIPLKHAIQCAIIAVEEILKSTPNEIHGYTEAPNGQIMIVDNPGKLYWQSVLSELRALA